MGSVNFNNQTNGFNLGIDQSTIDEMASSMITDLVDYIADALPPQYMAALKTIVASAREAMAWAVESHVTEPLKAGLPLASGYYTAAIQKELKAAASDLGYAAIRDFIVRKLDNASDALGIDHKVKDRVSDVLQKAMDKSGAPQWQGWAVCGRAAYRYGHRHTGDMYRDLLSDSLSLPRGTTIEDSLKVAYAGWQGPGTPVGGELTWDAIANYARAGGLTDAQLVWANEANAKQLKSGRAPYGIPGYYWVGDKGTYAKQPVETRTLEELEKIALDQLAGRVIHAGDVVEPGKLMKMADLGLLTPTQLGKALDTYGKKEGPQKGQSFYQANKTAIWAGLALLGLVVVVAVVKD